MCNENQIDEKPRLTKEKEEEKDKQNEASENSTSQLSYTYTKRCQRHSFSLVLDELL